MNESGPDYEAWANFVRQQLGRQGPELSCYILLDKETGEVKQTDLPGLWAW